MDMMKINKAQPEDSCPNCVLYRKEIDELNEAFTDADDESVCQYMHYEDEISELKDECAYWCMKYEDSAEIKRLKAEYSSGSRSKKKVLEEVEGPVSNTTGSSSQGITKNDYH